MLVEIAASEPTVIEALPERQTVTAQNLGFTLRRLIAVGLVRRFHRPEHPKRYDLAIDDRHPVAVEIAAVLRAIARWNRLAWTPSAWPKGTSAVQEAENVTGLTIFGRPWSDIMTIFGSVQRTTAVLIIGALEAVDATTIATLTGIAKDGDMHKLMDPIEDDRLVLSEMVGSIRLYSLAPGPWVKPLRALVMAILARDPQLAGRVAAARVLLVSGGFSGRTHLRRRLSPE